MSAYLNTRVSLYGSRLCRDGELDALISIPEQEAADMLVLRGLPQLQTGFISLTAPKPDARSLEQRVIAQVLDETRVMIRPLSGDARTFLSFWTARFEISNVVDGGNSKTELALVGYDGAVLGVARAGSGSYHAVGRRRMIETFQTAVRTAALEGGLDPAAVDPEVGVYCLAEADLPVDDRRLTRTLGRSGLARSTVVRNDAFTGLRAGTTEGWGIAMVCGAGMNCAGIGPTGRAFRFPSPGAFSGDEGGGDDLAIRALAAAIHSRDGGGPRTAIERLVPAHFGLGTGA